ncbi:hypothetical protein CVT25_001511 [Psilocybe cyanescens]|uniref:Uncharacterized protein n=1 Tax=Psilocybe cyanescens TaxID=93625 RepID=A0A409XHI8_PSICY|nr:hypothetical protein CVT25_001511 [Psilocybe cyanescens]
MEKQQLVAEEQELERCSSIAQLGRVTMLCSLFSFRGRSSGSSLSSGSHRFKRKVDPAYARRTRPHNTPTHMHLARSAEVVYTSKRDRLAGPLVDPDDHNRAMGWNLQKRHKDLKGERERVRGVVRREKGDQENEKRANRRDEIGRSMAVSTTFPPSPPVRPLGVGGPVGDGRARSKGRARASRNPGLTTIRPLRVTAGPCSVAPVSDPIKADKSASADGRFSRDEAPHVGKRPRQEQRRRTVSEWHGEEEPSRASEELRRGSGSRFEGKGRTVSIASSIAPGRVFTAADADAGVNAYDLAAEDAARAAATTAKQSRFASRQPYGANTEGYEDDEVDMDVEMDKEREEEAFEFDEDNEGEFFYPPGEVSNVKGAKASAADATKTGIATRFSSPPLIPGLAMESPTST